MRQDVAGPDFETLTSLRRRGLMSADAYQLQVAALAVAMTGRPWPLWLQPFAVLVTILGCIIAIPGIVIQEFVSIGLGPILAAPIIEEAMKPAGIYILMLRWPRAILGRAHTAFLAAIAGLTFGLIESFIYVTVYFPDEGSDFVWFRFTVPVMLHVIASAIVGWGLSRTIIDWAAGRAAFPKVTRNFYFAGVGLHSLYNTTAIILVLTGVLDFD